MGNQRRADRAEARAAGIGVDDEDAAAGAQLAAILGRELRVVEGRGADALARALRLVAPPAEVIAHLHPDDAALLTDGDLAEVPGMAVTVVPDASVSRGDCRLDVGDGAVDASIASALARARAALLGDGDWADELDEPGVAAVAGA